MSGADLYCDSATHKSTTVHYRKKGLVKPLICWTSLWVDEEQSLNSFFDASPCIPQPKSRAAELQKVPKLLAIETHLPQHWWCLKCDSFMPSKFPRKCSWSKAASLVKPMINHLSNQPLFRGVGGQNIHHTKVEVSEVCPQKALPTGPPVTGEGIKKPKMWPWPLVEHVWTHVFW